MVQASPLLLIIIAETGYPVINADDISKDILANDPKVRNDIIKEFGARAFDGKKINKQYLSDIYFFRSKEVKENKFHPSS